MQLLLGVPTTALDAFDHLVDADALPRIEHLGEQRAAVIEVAVEAPLGDAERPCERLDPDRLGATCREGGEALIDPSPARCAGERHRVGYATRRYT